MNVADLLQLQQPLKDGGIRSVNFFNGRLLTSKDLSREQQAHRESDARLGLALGEGVAFGLEVTLDTTAGLPAGAVVQVSAGLAINRAGQTLRLALDTSVALQRQFDAGGADCACSFAPCDPLLGGTYVAGAGLYVLTIAPSDVAEGRAPSNGLDPLNTRCANDATVEALQFRLLSLNAQALAGLDLASDSLRNEVAYRCFGSGIQASWLATLTTALPRSDDVLDALRKLGLSKLEVPLALLSFRGASQVAFIDNWAVRRPLHRPESAPPAGLVEARRLAVGHAMFMQFQAQIGDLVAPFVLPVGVTAKSHFRWLPPVGVIPVAEETDDSDAAATHFFTGMTYHAPTHIHGAQAEALVRTSLAMPPIDTAAAEMVWLYRVRENRMAIELGSPPLPTGTLVFASGHLPYQGDARYDLARFDFANYALTP